MLRLVLALCGLSLFPLSSATVLAQEPIKGQDIDPQTVAAYEKLGAVYGGFQPNPFDGFFFRPGADAAREGVPGFILLKPGPFPVACLADSVGSRTGVAWQRFPECRRLEVRAAENFDRTRCARKDRGEQVLLRSPLLWAIRR